VSFARGGGRIQGGMVVWGGTSKKTISVTTGRAAGGIPKTFGPFAWAFFPAWRGAGWLIGNKNRRGGRGPRGGGLARKGHGVFGKNRLFPMLVCRAGRDRRWSPAHGYRETSFGKQIAGCFPAGKAPRDQNHTTMLGGLAVHGAGMQPRGGPRGPGHRFRRSTPAGQPGRR